MQSAKYVPQSIRDRYEVKTYRSAGTILHHEFGDEFREICEVLEAFSLCADDFHKPGGNESDIPKFFNDRLHKSKEHPNNHWEEKRLEAELQVKVNGVVTDTKPVASHLIDFVRGAVALDVEWNSKDQTFDRDLVALDQFHRHGIISVGILVTRSDELDDYIRSLGQLVYNGQPQVHRDGRPKMVFEKYGASTTQTGKLINRIIEGRGGGCPILVIGITPRCIRG